MTSGLKSDCDSCTLSFRKLAPAGGFPSPLGIFNAWLELKQILKGSSLTAAAVLANRLCTRFSFSEVLPVCNGTEALYRLFQNASLGSKIGSVLMSAYTCPDIAYAAVKAGVKVIPLDIDSGTLEMRLDRTLGSDDVTAVVLSNLYGLPDSFSGFEKLVPRPQIIDDGCQSLLSSINGKHVGARTGFGVLSFGRGKALCGIGGGAVLSTEPQNRNYGLEPTSYLGELRDLLVLTLSWALEHPLLYSIPTALPFLEIGETTIKERNFSKSPGLISILATLANLKTVDANAKHAVAIARGWHDRLPGLGLQEPFINRGFTFDGSVVPLRYPILFADSERRKRVEKALARFGGSVSYNKTLFDFPELVPHLVGDRCKEADSVSKRLLTLPTHKYVTERDMDAVQQIIRGV